MEMLIIVRVKEGLTLDFSSLGLVQMINGIEGFKDLFAILFQGI